MGFAQVSDVEFLTICTKVAVVDARDLSLIESAGLLRNCEFGKSWAVGGKLNFSVKWPPGFRNSLLRFQESRLRSNDHPRS